MQNKNKTKVDELLSVRHYTDRMPLIPEEDRHASSEQHRFHKHCRWLLHTRRATLEEKEDEEKEETLGAAAEDAEDLPLCAGVGDPDAADWTCRECRDALCHVNAINMPRPALANLMWGGRKHPLYQNLSNAMRMLKPRPTSDAQGHLRQG